MKKLIITLVALLALNSCGTLSSQSNNPMNVLKSTQDIRDAVITLSKGTLMVKGSEAVPLGALEDRLVILSQIPHKKVGNRIVWENVTISVEY